MRYECNLCWIIPIIRWCDISPQKDDIAFNIFVKRLVSQNTHFVLYRRNDSSRWKLQFRCCWSGRVPWMSGWRCPACQQRLPAGKQMAHWIHTSSSCVTSLALQGSSSATGKWGARWARRVLNGRCPEHDVCLLLTLFEPSVLFPQSRNIQLELLFLRRATGRWSWLFSTERSICNSPALSN